MRKVILLFCLIGTLQVFSQEYKLVWEDRFDGKTLDLKKWSYVTDGNGGGNRELQFYRQENVSLGKEPESGLKCLIITAKREKYQSHEITSGKIITNGKMDFRYGKVEARIKFPKTTNGLWPAFWMLGSDYYSIGWPKSGEVDILEMGNATGIKQNTQDKYFNGACHWGEENINDSHPNYSRASTNSYSLQEGFHLFTMIWNEDAIKMYLDLDKYPDNKPYYEIAINGSKELNAPGRYFKKPFYLIFNLAAGGNFTGIWDPNQITALNSGEAKMYVDFVRVYQMKNERGNELLIHKKKKK